MSVNSLARGDPDVVKVEHRFCVVCQDTVQGQVAICPKSEHWVCAVHLQERSFDKCPLCKTPWLVARDHDLMEKKEDKSSLMRKLMRPSVLTVEEMLAKFRQAGVGFWYDWVCALGEDRGNEGFYDVQRMAISCDRNWIFFSTLWEEEANRNRIDSYHQMQTSMNWMDDLMNSERFL